MEIRWIEPSNGGSNITHYNVEWDEGRGNELFYPLATTLGYETVTVTDSNPHFRGGDAYVFRVEAVNAVGESLWSEPSDPIIAATVPQAPTKPVLQSRTQTELRLTWTVPSDGGS